MEAIIGLVGAVIGGSLVLVSNLLIRRSEERERRSNQLLSAAADLVGTYGGAWSALIGARKQGLQLPTDDELFYLERNRKWAALFMLPGSEQVRDGFEACAEAMQAMVKSFDADDDAFKEARNGLEAAMNHVQDITRRSIAAHRGR